MTFYGIPTGDYKMIDIENGSVNIHIVNWAGDNDIITVPITDNKGNDIETTVWLPMETKARRPSNPYYNPGVIVNPLPVNPFTQPLPQERPPEITQPTINKNKEEQKPSNDHLEIF